MDTFTDIILLFLVNMLALYKAPVPSPEVEVKKPTKFIVGLVGMVILIFGLIFFVGSFIRPKEGHVLFGILCSGLGVSVIKSAYKVNTIQVTTD